MLKMLMDPMGGIVMTNDGNAILREVWFAVSKLDKIRCQSCNSCLNDFECFKKKIAKFEKDIILKGWEHWFLPHWKLYDKLFLL